MSSTPITSTPTKEPSYSVATLADGAIVMDDTFNKVATVHRGNGQGIADAFQMAQKIIQALKVPPLSSNSGLTSAEITKDRDQWKERAKQLDGQNDTQAKSVADLTRQCEGYRKTIDDISKTRDGYAKDIDNLARQCEGYRRTIDDLVRNQNDLNRQLAMFGKSNEGKDAVVTDLNRQLEATKKGNDEQIVAILGLKRQLEEAKKATPATTQHAAYVPIEYRRLADGVVLCNDKSGGRVPAPNDVVVISGSPYRVTVNYFSYDGTGRQAVVTSYVVS